MTGKDLFIELGKINPKYYEEAESATLAPARKKLHRPLLIAALIALMLTLAGCAAVVILSIQNMKVGDQEVTYPIYDDNYKFQGNETIAQHVLTLAGLKGTPSYQAALEWFEFQKTYDKDGAILDAVWGSMPEYDHQYDAYGAYSQDMVDKLDEIAAKYSLKLQGPMVKLHGGKRFYEEMGIDSILMPDSKATVEFEHPFAYENGSWGSTVFWMTMPDEEGQWPYRMLNSLYYNKKDCFSTDLVALADTGDWEEWNYTTASGRDVLILLSPTEGIGWIICDRPDAMISIRVTVSHDVGSDEGGKQHFEELGHMKKEQFEQVADNIDFNMAPAYQGEFVSDIDTANMSQTVGDYTITVKSVDTDGYAAIIRLGITGPAGVPLVNPDIQYYNLNCGNWANEFFTPADGRKAWSSMTAGTEDDGDGLSNTMDYVIRTSPTMEDGSLPFNKDAVWNIYFEDLIGSWWDGETSQQKEETIAEGVWNFDLTFENGDFREFELITEPVPCEINTGWSPTKGDIIKEAEILSFKIRSISTTIEHTGQGTSEGGSGKFNQIVMKDGSRVDLFGHTFQNPIDLDQVDYILLTNGNQIPMEGARLVTPGADAADIPEDDRELELIKSPVKTQVYTGMDPVDGHDCYGDIEIQSFVLRQNSATMDIGEGNSVAMYINPNTFVVMKDGSHVKLNCPPAGKGGVGRQITFETESPLDLDQVDHVLMPDGTEIPVE